MSDNFFFIVETFITSGIIKTKLTLQICNNENVNLIVKSGSVTTSPSTVICKKKKITNNN